MFSRTDFCLAVSTTQTVQHSASVNGQGYLGDKLFTPGTENPSARILHAHTQVTSFVEHDIAVPGRDLEQRTATTLKRFDQWELSDATPKSPPQYATAEDPFLDMDNDADSFATDIFSQGLPEHLRDPRSVLSVYLHMTASSNIASIHQTGLFPAGPSGTQTGLGDPDGKCCSDGVYVVNPNKSIMDGKEGKVIVVSTREPSKDPNYRHGEAGVFYPNNDQNNIPPLREVSVKRHTESTYSFVLPMTPSTQEGGVALFHLLSLKNPTNAQSALSDMFRDAFRLHYDFNHNIQEIKPAETEESSLLKQWQIDDLQLSESEEFDSADVNTEASDTGLFLFDD